MSRLTFLEGTEATTLDEARVAVVPAPYEHTVSWHEGTADGPRAILEASKALELLDEQERDVPASAGVWTDDPLALAGLAPAEATRRVGTRVGELLDAGKWVATLGGEHSITPGAVVAAADRHPDLHVVQLDAHADLRESYLGDPGSHACAIARCLERAPVRAIGIRSYSPEESARLAEGIPGYSKIDAWEMDRADFLERALEGLTGKPVYVTFDLDYFDPAILPATGTPEPGGGAWWPTLALLRELFSRARVVAADVVEHAPREALHHADYTAARLVYKLIGYAVRSGW